MNLYHRIWAKVQTIPAGTVASYGGVARSLGYPRGARLVGWALRQLPPDTPVPWQRVVNREGILSLVNPRVTASGQARRLQEEGVKVRLKQGVLSVENPVWHEFK